LVVSRRGLLVGGASLVASPLLAQATEGGESGEGAASAGLEDDVAFLVELGLFDGAHRMIGAMVAQGAAEAAAEQLESSHHAHYDDLEGAFDARGITPFEDAVTAFAAAVMARADAAEVATRLDAVLAPIAAIRATGTPAQRAHADEVLVRTAASEFEGGVDTDGTMLSDHEYRDGWGFLESARADLTALSESTDPAVTDAATRALAALEPVSTQFGSLMAESVPGADVSVILGAAARIEIARLRL
jgi:hypothetical protein